MKKNIGYRNGYKPKSTAQFIDDYFKRMATESGERQTPQKTQKPDNLT